MDHTPSTTNLFVGNLTTDTTLDKLREMFSPYGEIESCRVMTDPNTQNSRGFGFVKYATEEQANYAIQCMNNYNTSSGGKLLVKFANATEAEISATSNNVFVKGLPATINAEAVKALFSPYGLITEIKVLADATTNQSRGQALVRFSDVESAQRAIAGLTNYKYPGTLKGLVVKFADTEKAKHDRRQRTQRKIMSQTRYSPYGGMSGFVPPPPVPPSTAAAYAQYYAALAQGEVHGHVPSPPPPIPSYAPPPPMYHQQPQQVQVAPPSGPHGATDPNNLYVYHLPPEGDDALLYKLFSPYGAIQSVKIGRDPASGLCKGFGFVRMVNHNDAWNALNAVNGQKCGAKTLSVSFKK